jgi:hypothetical protein
VGLALSPPRRPPRGQQRAASKAPVGPWGAQGSAPPPPARRASDPHAVPRPQTALSTRWSGRSRSPQMFSVMVYEISRLVRRAEEIQREDLHILTLRR